MNLIFADLNRLIITNLEKEFNNIKNASFHITDIGQALNIGSGNKFIINAGNFLSIQDGGVDKAISFRLSNVDLSIEKETQKIIDRKYFGQLPVGSAILVKSPDPKIHGLFSNYVCARKCWNEL